jgi:pyruvate dehydrogenase E2 component (dihydrolipoyllysine-residue acetyltransferase)
MSEFRMPSLGADMEWGRVTQWKIKQGDRVKRGDIVAEIETEKADIDAEIFTTGIVHELLVKEGEKVPVGTVLATILEEGEQAPPPTRVRVSPLAKTVAATLGVDLATVHGTGPEGSITRADVERAAGKRSEQKPSPVTDDHAGMRHAIALAMSRSNREIPHYYLEQQIDMTKALDWLTKENLKRSVKDRLLPAALLIRAVARALKDVPELNAHWIDDHLDVKQAVNIGFAVALRQGGLMTPAILKADQKNIGELMAALADIVARTREGHLRTSEMTDGTITITNLGDLGVDTVYGVIYPPQVALVGFGRIQERPWASGGMLGVRQVLTATLAGDHRATDGRRGAQFLEALNRCLQEPEKL